MDTRVGERFKGRGGFCRLYRDYRGYRNYRNYGDYRSYRLHRRYSLPKAPYLACQLSL